MGFFFFFFSVVTPQGVLGLEALQESWAYGAVEAVEDTGRYHSYVNQARP